MGNKKDKLYPAKGKTETNPSKEGKTKPGLGIRTKVIAIVAAIVGTISFACGLAYWKWYKIKDHLPESWKSFKKKEPKPRTGSVLKWLSSGMTSLASKATTAVSGVSSTVYQWGSNAFGKLAGLFGKKSTISG